MAVESNMVDLGTPMPAFNLPDLSGNLVDSADFAGQPLLVAFVCNHCPYVRHVELKFAEVAAAVPTVAICSNDPVSHPEDGVAGLTEQVARTGWSFPYLVDRTQDVARQFGAACTPDFFLYDADGNLAYRGALDGSSPKNGVPLTGEDLREAISLVVEGKSVPEPHRPSLGCSIKWTAE